MAHRAHHQVTQRVVAHGHFGHDADAQAQAHIGLDHIGVDGFEHDAGRELARREGMVDLAAPGEGGVVGDEGLVRQVVQAGRGYSFSVKVDDLPKFSGSGGLVAERDFRSFREKHKLDKLVVISINTLGAERPYSAYVPTGAPKGVFRAVGYMVDLQTNSYEWYQPVEFLKAADGSWDEPPTFPGITNAYFQALELGKDALVENFN